MTEATTATLSLKQKLLRSAIEWAGASLLAVLLLVSAGVEVSSANPLRPEFFVWSVFILLVICVWFFQKVCALCGRWCWPLQKRSSQKNTGE